MPKTRNYGLTVCCTVKASMLRSRVLHAARASFICGLSMQRQGTCCSSSLPISA